MISLRRPSTAYLLVLLMVAGYAIFFSYFTITKHLSFMTYMYDLGVYDHRLWVILTDGDPNFPFGGNQQSQLFYALVLVYAIYASPVLLLVIQSWIVPLGALWIHGLAKRELGGKIIPVLLAMVYLLYPPLHGASSFDFHFQAFLPTLFLAAAYYYFSQKWKRYYLFLGLILSTTRYASYFSVTFGLSLLLPHLKKLLSRKEVNTAGLLSNAQARYALVTVLISLVTLVIHNAVQIESFVVTPTNPAAVSLQERLIYMVMLYGPLAFVPLLDPSQILASAPWLIVAFTTDNREYLAIYNQHPAFVTAFLFIGLVIAMKRFSVKGRSVAMALILFATISFFVVSDPVFAKPYPPITPRWPNVTEKDQVLEAMVSTIPDEASVLTQNNIAPHLTHRKEIFITLGSENASPDYIIVDRGHYSYYDPSFGVPPAAVVPSLISSGTYGLRAQCDQMLLYQKGFKGVTARPPGCNS